MGMSGDFEQAVRLSLSYSSYCMLCESLRGRDIQICTQSKRKEMRERAALQGNSMLQQPNEPRSQEQDFVCFYESQWEGS